MTGTENAIQDLILLNSVILGGRKLQNLSESKKKIEEKIHELDEMLADLDADDTNDADGKRKNTKIDINGLDVVDVLHNILN